MSAFPFAYVCRDLSEGKDKNMITAEKLKLFLSVNDSFEKILEEPNETEKEVEVEEETNQED